MPMSKSWFEDHIGNLENIYSLEIGAFMSLLRESARVNCGIRSWAVEKPCVIMNCKPFLLWHFRIFIFLITHTHKELARKWPRFRSHLEVRISPFLKVWTHTIPAASLPGSQTHSIFPFKSPLKENTSISLLWLCNSEMSKAISFKLGRVVVFTKKEKSRKIWRRNFHCNFFLLS